MHAGSSSTRSRGGLALALALLALAAAPGAARAQDLGEPTADPPPVEGQGAAGAGAGAELGLGAETGASYGGDTGTEREGAPPAADPPAPEPVAEPVEEAAPDEAPLLTPVGSLFSRFELRRGYDALGLASPRLYTDQDAIYYRARFGLQTRPLDIGHDLTVAVRFLPQSSGVWHVGGDTLEDAGLDLHEGLLMLSGSGFRVDVGRFEMAYGEHLVIGNVAWHETGRSFDGVRLHLTPEGADFWIDAFSTWIAEGRIDGTPTPFLGGDVLFNGVYAGLGGLFSDHMEMDVYLLQLMRIRGDDPATGVEVVPSASEITLGLRVKNKFGDLDYRVEGGFQLRAMPGDDAVAGQVDLELGYTLLDGGLRLAIEGLYASGNDPATPEVEGWNQLFPTAHKFLGFTDVMGPRTNVASPVFHLLAKLGDRLKLMLDLHSFFRPENGGDAYAGLEVDMGGVFVIGTGLNLRGTYSVFLPNEDVWGTADAVHLFELELAYTL